MEFNGLHIELTNKCTLKCPRCSRTESIEQFPKAWKNKSIDVSALKDFLDVDLTGKQINLCGNYGDPIYHDGLTDMVKFLKANGATINIATNGSYRTAEWWEELAQALTIDDAVTFAIDGTPDNFTRYRINADWASMMEGILVMAKSPARMRWQYILFSYNLDTVDEARQLSEDLGFNEFFTMDSGRWDQGTEWLTPFSDRLSESKIQRRQGKEIQIDPLCHNGNEHFISADGYYTPCCRIAEHRFYYKTDFYKQKDTYDITKTTLSVLMSADKVVEFIDGVSDLRLPVCQFSCPKIKNDI